jgi:hypothetical protein
MAATRAPLGRRLAGPEGQSTAMVVSMLFFLVLFVGVVVDVGQAVNRRIALQITADAGAYTGASAMAIGMNDMARWNKRMQDFWAGLTIATLGFTVVPCEVAEPALTAYDRGRELLGNFYETVNRGFATIPYDEAKRVSRYNSYDFFPGEVEVFEADRDSYVEWDSDADVGIESSRPRDRLVVSPQVEDGTMPVTRLPALSPSRRHVTFTCTTLAPPFIRIIDRDIDVWYEKAQGTDFFVWRVKAPATRALMFDEVFGPNAIPEMKAVAVAQPVGGSIKDGEPRYIVNMVPTALVMADGARISDPTHYRGWRRVVH